ncbi:MAG TPA: alanine--glyoxylate aminotransferase family protein [Dehalococcoidales bacterium]|nr:alanine--glyoxylate aminotransferase family protein [Dehalococcoidales bacterium]
MTQLRIPGPTPCPPEVLQAMARPMINHRGPEYKKMLHEVTDKIKQVAQTKNDLLILTGSGTGGMEAAVANTLSPGDKVLSVSIGAFGDRWAKIAKTFGASVVSLNFEWGQAADPAAVKQSLQANPDVSAVLVTHNETSTGVTNDLGAIARVVKAAGKLLLVDAISSLASIPLPVDEWGCDVVITASQKGWMVPPGLAFVSVSQAAWEAHARATMPRFYWDFTRARTFLETGENPWTPAISVVFALSVALDMMLKEGIKNIFKRHARLGQMTRDGVKALGLSIFAEEGHASNTVTAITIPDGVDGKRLRQIMQSEHGIVLAGGQAHLESKIFRIGHLGLVTEDEIKELLAALKVALPKAGFAGVRR